jgi:acyl transferase domain-containing protein
MDPQQRLVLMSALEALEDAGYAPDSTPSFQRERVGVYMGVATGDYVDNLRDDIDVYYSPGETFPEPSGWIYLPLEELPLLTGGPAGTLRAFISGRISYAFKLGGPSMVIDTACSSSLVSIYHACMALRAGDCGTALAGGVNVMTSPDMYSGLSRAHFLSPTGQCKPFDEAADGYCRAEGCAVVVLKRLSDAVAEGDHIHGVIRAVGINQCGMAKSITHPHSDTQAALMKSVLASARASPRSIGVVEAHGTGTQAGDAAEMASVRAVFCPRTPEQPPLYVSSVKGNIGHLEAASGVVGLAKLLLMMKTKQIPAQASFTKLNPRLLATTSPGQVTIPTCMTEWKRTASQTTRAATATTTTPRRALLNNFGASGSNAALVLEEFDLAAQQQQDRQRRPQEEVENEARPAARSHHVLNISAKTARALETAKRSMVSYLTEHPNVALHDLCYTANARRQEYPHHRLSIVVSDRSKLLDQLQRQQLLEEKSAARQGPRPDHHQQPHRTVFVFSGQGGVYPGMGAELLSTVPFFRSLVGECDETLAAHGFPTVASFLANSKAGQAASSSSETIPGDQVIISQCACFVLEYALATMWRHWGVSPDLVIGHR